MTGAAYLHAEGSFEVKLTPQADDAGTGLGRMSAREDLARTVRGNVARRDADRDGERQGHGAYVAVERVTGKVLGRRGSFSLVHRGVMTNGQQELSITVVPGSGTEDFQGFEGAVTIRIEPGGKHFYVLSGTLPGQLVLRPGCADRCGGRSLSLRRAASSLRRSTYHEVRLRCSLLVCAVSLRSRPPRCAHHTPVGALDVAALRAAGARTGSGERTPSGAGGSTAP